ncbi:hypothetical protein GCM10020221_29660 [Streptomyces thioluteus]|uniref:Uncharacterized protein n=1 Tax=Streptomyces thioluteus TaxID=66431 RepID=A0ABN3WYA6_STRTU
MGVGGDRSRWWATWGWFFAGAAETGTPVVRLRRPVRISLAGGSDNGGGLGVLLAPAPPFHRFPGAGPRTRTALRAVAGLRPCTPAGASPPVPPPEFRPRTPLNTATPHSPSSCPEGATSGQTESASPPGA